MVNLNFLLCSLIGLCNSTEATLHYTWASSEYESFSSWLIFIYFFFIFKYYYYYYYHLYRKVYALNVVGVIPDELWTLSFLFNLYDFFFICLFTCVLHEYWLPSFSCLIGLNLDLETVLHYVNQLKFMLDAVVYWFSRMVNFHFSLLNVLKFEHFLQEFEPKLLDR